MLAERPDLRLFVALWPDGDLGARIAQAARAAIGDGRAVPAERLHLTLAFIGRLPADRLDACSQALGTVRGGSFDLCLDRFGFWRRNGILWLGMREPGAHCAQQLAALVTGALQQASLPYDRRPFGAHLTVARKCRQPGSMSQPAAIGWRVSHWQLIESTLDPAGSVYRVRAEWPLS